MGTKMFDLVTLTLMFDPLIKNFNLGYNFQMVWTRMLIIHMSVDLFMGTKIFDLVTLTLVFDLLVENSNLAVFFDW